MHPYQSFNRVGVLRRNPITGGLSITCILCATAIIISVIYFYRPEIHYSEETLQELKRLQYINSTDISNRIVQQILMRAQELANLKITGEADSETMKFMQLPKCMMPESENVDMRSWNKTTITLCINSHETNKQIEESFADYTKKASKIYSSFCGLIFKVEEDCEKTNYDVMLTFQYKGVVEAEFLLAIDSSTVGYYKPPSRETAHGTIYLNKHHNWSIQYDKNKKPTDFFYATILHEMGHAMGLPHSPNKNSAMFEKPGPLFLAEEDVNRLYVLYNKLKYQIVYNSFN